MPKLEEILGAVDTWYQERLRSAPISTFTPAYNQAFDAYNDLKVRLKALFPAEPDQPAADAADEKE